MFRQTRTILLEMGHFFQVQDDYLGCYGNFDVIGKDSTDIEEGKCTWLIVVALQRATPEQRKILDVSIILSNSLLHKILLRSLVLPFYFRHIGMLWFLG